MNWIHYSLAAGLAPLFFILGLLLVILGNKGRLGGWIYVRDSKRVPSIIAGFISLILVVVIVNVVVAGTFLSNNASQGISQVVIVTKTPIVIPSEENTETATISPFQLDFNTSTPSPMPSPTPSRSLYDTSDQCSQPFDPPCSYIVQDEQHMLGVAKSVTEDDDLADLYAGLIRNLNRDQFGYVAPVPEIVRIPHADLTIDVDYYQYYFAEYEWDICDVPINIESGNLPCLLEIDHRFFLPENRDGYKYITEAVFPLQPNAEKCIRAANTYLHLGGEFYGAIILEQNSVIIIPNIYAPNRESCT